MSVANLLMEIGLGIAIELILYLLLRRVGRMNSKSAAVVVALASLLVYVPRALLSWPGADVFAIHLAIYLILAYILGIVGQRREAGNGWHWAPALLVLFFAFIVGMNVVFLGVAEQGISGIFAELLPQPRSADVADSRFPGTVARDFQKKEALYNAYLEQVKEQHQRGWQVQKGWLAQPVVGQPAVFLVRVTDAGGEPVSGAHVTGQFLRTSNSNYDMDFAMTETSPGEYRLETRLTQPGLWQLVLMIRRGEDLHEIQAITSVKDVAKAGS